MVYFFLMKTIRIIDDDKAIRNYYEALIGMFFPCNVFTADDGDTGIKIMEEHPEVDLIILDLQMKRINGWEALPKLKEIKSDVKVIISSSYIYGNDEKKLKEMGADLTIIKPFLPADFRAVVMELLGL
ncbi:MAG: response regulator [Nitrospirae bacterium]|nr:MAG: response regulator [Nitrospirota bacterium]